MRSDGIYMSIWGGWCKFNSIWIIFMRTKTKQLVYSIIIGWIRSYEYVLNAIGLYNYNVQCTLIVYVFQKYIELEDAGQIILGLILVKLN